MSTAERLIIKVGQKVRINVASDLCGIVVGYGHETRTNPHNYYLVELSDPLWTEGRKLSIRILVVHPENVFLEVSNA